MWQSWSNSPQRDSVGPNIVSAALSGPFIKGFRTLWTCYLAKVFGHWRCRATQTDSWFPITFGCTSAYLCPTSACFHVWPAVLPEEPVISPHFLAHPSVHSRVGCFVTILIQLFLRAMKWSLFKRCLQMPDTQTSVDRKACMTHCASKSPMNRHLHQTLKMPRALLWVASVLPRFRIRRFGVQSRNLHFKYSWWF